MGSAKLVELSMENVSEFIESNRVAILDFWGSDCGVCVAMLPVLEGFASDWEGVCARQPLFSSERFPLITPAILSRLRPTTDEEGQNELTFRTSL